VANTPTKDELAHVGIRTIGFPSSLRRSPEGEWEPTVTVDVEVTDNADLIYGDPEDGVEPRVPNDLRPIAERCEYEGFEETDNLLEKLDESERIQLSRYRRWLIAERLRRPTGLTPQDIRKWAFADQVAVFRVLTHGDLKERVVLSSFRDLQGRSSSNGSRQATRSRAK
jgi:hypothetical protein